MPIGNFATVTKNLLMGFFDNKPKKKGGLFDSKYEPDAWRKNIPYNDIHDSHIWDWDAPDKDGDGYRDGSVGDSDLWDD